MFHRSSGKRAALVALILSGILVPALTAPASAADNDVVRWASPNGSGSTCSQARPCALDTALSQTRAATASMTSDLVVRLLGGTYRRTSPISLNASDSGRNGFRVRIEAAAGTAPVISGGRLVTGWTQTDRSRGIWRASVPRGTVSRHLFVNGTRAQLASGPALDVLGSMSITATGYQIQKSTIGSWSNLDTTELVYPAGGKDVDGGGEQLTPWSWTSCGITSFRNNALTVDAGCWRNARSSFVGPDGSTLPFITEPTIVQNNYALLDTPGEFYHDQKNSYVYYKPRSGESMASASVVMPTATSLVAASDVSNLTVSGLTFEHATWTPDANIGVFVIQANVIAGSPTFSPADPSTSTVIPSALTFQRANGVELIGATVRRTGAGGVSFSGGGSGNVIRGNVVSDTSANGITVSEGVGLATATSYESDTLVENNVVRDIGREYLSAVGIMAAWVKRVTIKDNVVERTPHIGISLGWGWMNESEMVDNHVTGNDVINTMQSELNDGGAIYLMGRQGSSAMSTLVGNHISGYDRNYGAIYLDSGASHWLVTENVVENVNGAGWIYLQNIANHGFAWSNLVAGNYSTTDRQYLAPLGTHELNYVADNKVGLATLPVEASTLVTDAGPKGAYAVLQ